MYLGAPLLRPKLEPTKIEVSESGDDPESYALTRVSRPERKQSGLNVSRGHEEMR